MLSEVRLGCSVFFIFFHTPTLVYWQVISLSPFLSRSTTHCSRLTEAVLTTIKITSVSFFFPHPLSTRSKNAAFTLVLSVFFSGCPVFASHARVPLNILKRLGRRAQFTDTINYASENTSWNSTLLCCSVWSSSSSSVPLWITNRMAPPSAKESCEELSEWWVQPFKPALFFVVVFFFGQIQ